MEHDLEAYRKQCAGICAAVPKNSTNLKLFRCSGLIKRNSSKYIFKPSY